jgi:hypothetical protein
LLSVSRSSQPQAEPSAGYQVVWGERALKSALSFGHRQWLEDPQGDIVAPTYQEDPPVSSDAPLS